MKNLCLMKLQGFLVLFCSLPFHSCETGESEDVLQESNSVSEKKFTNGYIPKGIVKTETLPNELKVSVDEVGSYFYEDIVFPKQFIDSISKQGPMTRGAAKRDYTLYWTDNIIPYKIAPGFSSFEKNMIRQAITTIAENSCLEFVEATSKNKNMIYFYPATSDGIYTNMIGKNPYGANEVHLQHSKLRSLPTGDIEALNLLYGPKIHLRRCPLYGVSDRKKIRKTYNNIIHFLGINGKKIALKYPRIVIYRTYIKSYSTRTNREIVVFSDPTRLVIDAGLSSVDLGKSTYEYQENNKGVGFYMEEGYQIMN